METAEKHGGVGVHVCEASMASVVSGSDEQDGGAVKQREKAKATEAPVSAPMVEEIADFWGKYHFGRGWRKRVGLQ